MTALVILTILNSLAIAYLLLSHKSRLYITISKDTTFYADTIVGYNITLWKKTSENCASGLYTIYIPVKNKKRVEVDENVLRLINGSVQDKRQFLYATFSWFRNWKDVREFEKNYSVVDEKLVKRLINEFRDKYGDEKQSK